MDPKKIYAMQDWEPPSNLKDVRTFLGFATFYHHFIHNYSRIVQLITFLTIKEFRSPGQWSSKRHSTH
jgi:hypothetical protein